MELWKPAPGWEGLYEVSDAGRVRSLDRKIVVRNQLGVLAERNFSGRVLKASPGGSHGYRAVSFTAPGRARETHLVHSLVLRAFRGPPAPGLEGCHNNGNRLDCRLDNLRWDTRSSNALDAVKHGKRSPRGESAGTSKLTDAAVREIRATRGVSMRALARKFGVAHRTISAVIHGLSWTHI